MSKRIENAWEIECELESTCNDDECVVVLRFTAVGAISTHEFRLTEEEAADLFGQLRPCVEVISGEALEVD